jgi:20S proteasome alpha/beta subunit
MENTHSEFTTKNSALDNPYIKHRSQFKPSMTYALGMKCTNGVILITDRKLTFGHGAEPEYIDKIQGDISGVLWACAGAVSEFEIFRRDIKDFVQIKKSRNEIITIDGFIKKLSQTTYEIFEKYRYDYGGFEVLVGISGKTSGDGKSWLGLILESGLIEPVNRYKAIGSGAPFGSVFVQEKWKQMNGMITMDKAAELGYLVIKYIERLELDDAVGLGKFKHPQMRFIPDNEQDYGPTDDFLDDIAQRVDEKLLAIINHIRT